MLQVPLTLVAQARIIILFVRLGHSYRPYYTIFIFLSYTVYVHMNTLEVIKQIVQYGRLAEKRKYAYTSSETIA